ncbi:polyamine transporter 3 [[Candida] railenensis]|uniref:Polyamine transporter 3 n=1 Tax=[Candida] railenensis TaxID=45579 RepID=A0A9P0QMR8_9ASCO|nr:polyamine transporter 3 [[Candida] railenensis]
MGESSLKSEQFGSHEVDLSSSSSNDTSSPHAYTGKIEQDLEKQNQITRSNTNNSVNTVSYSVREIYGDLDSEEIKVQRHQTRNTILSELVSRTEDAEEGIYYDSSKDEVVKDTLYEDLPDTTVATKRDGDEFADIDPELITWNGSSDPSDPRNWPVSTKVSLTALVSLYTLVSPMSTSMLSPAMTEISKEFGITNSVIAAMVVSIQLLAWAVGPLLIAPLSENHYFGRKSVLDASCWIAFFFNIGCALSQNTTQMIIFRFVGGIFGSCPINVGAGVLSDLWDAKSRNVALAGFSLAPLLGPVIAPLIAGFIVEHKSWRWVFYVLSIFNGAVAIFGTIFMKETYSPKLLRSRAKKLRKETGNNNLHTIYEIADGETTLGKMYLAINRPVKLLFTHPMIVGLGSYMAFTYGFMYLMIVTFPTVYQENYGFGKGTTGLMYIPMGVGFLLGVLFWTYAIGKVYAVLTERNGGVPKPEYRIPCLVSSGLIIPIGLVWYGWSAEKKLHWIMPSIGSAIFAFGLVCVFQSMQSYLIDMNTRFAASSVAAAALFRSLFGFTFPLFAEKMYGKLGYGWGNTMCAVIGLILGIPFPIFSYLYGERIRIWANKNIERDQLRRDKKNLERLRKQQESIKC